MKNTIGQSKLWVYSTAFLMSLNGGYINVICLVSILQLPVGYVTGNLTLAGDFFAKGYYVAFFHLFMLVFCFLFGSIVSGLIVKGQMLETNRRYNIVLILQILIVICATFLLYLGDTMAGYLLAFTMGLQNAMTTHYGSALIRTTHMTGTTTDLGILISQWLKREPIQFWKMRLYACLIIGFTIGSIIGAILYAKLHAIALTLSIIIYVLMLLLWYRYFRHD
tara:strand:- start:136898 stop:137563 length:666 start_codon:yes stop_codon:yes gene_type:complete